MPIFRSHSYTFENYITAKLLHITFLNDIHEDDFDIVTNCLNSLYTIWDFQRCLNEFKIYKVKFNGNRNKEFHITKNIEEQQSHKLEIQKFYKNNPKSSIIYSKI